MSESFGRCVASDHDGLHVQDDGCDNWQPERAHHAGPSHYEQLLAEVQVWRGRDEELRTIVRELRPLVHETFLASGPMEERAWERFLARMDRALAPRK